jgi:hypothetical protein
LSLDHANSHASVLSSYARPLLVSGRSRVEHFIRIFNCFPSAFSRLSYITSGRQTSDRISSYLCQLIRLIDLSSLVPRKHFPNSSFEERIRKIIGRSEDFVPLGLVFSMWNLLCYHSVTCIVMRSVSLRVSTTSLLAISPHLPSHIYSNPPTPHSSC